MPPLHPGPWRRAPRPPSCACTGGHAGAGGCLAPTQSLGTQLRRSTLRAPPIAGECDVLWHASPVSRPADPVLWSSGSALTSCLMSRTVHHCPCVSDTVARRGTCGGCHRLRVSAAAPLTALCRAPLVAVWASRSGEEVTADEPGRTGMVAEGGGGCKCIPPPIFFLLRMRFFLVFFFLHFFLHLCCLQFPFIAAIHGQICVRCTILIRGGDARAFICIYLHCISCISQLASPPPPRCMIAVAKPCLPSGPQAPSSAMSQHPSSPQAWHCPAERRIAVAPASISTGAFPHKRGRVRPHHAALGHPQVRVRAPQGCAGGWFAWALGWHATSPAGHQQGGVL